MSRGERVEARGRHRSKVFCQYLGKAMHRFDKPPRREQLLDESIRLETSYLSKTTARVSKATVISKKTTCDRPFVYGTCEICVEGGKKAAGGG